MRPVGKLAQSRSVRRKAPSLEGSLFEFPPRMPKHIAVSDDDEPLLASPSRPRRSTSSSAPKYKFDNSDEEEEEEDHEEDGSEENSDGQDEEEAGSGKDDSSQHGGDHSDSEKNSDDENLVEIASARKEKADSSDSDDEKRFLALMDKYSPAKPQQETKIKAQSKPAVSKDLQVAKGGSSKKKLELESSQEDKPKKKSEVGDETALIEGTGDASSKAGSSKIKFSRSVPLMIPNPKRISRNTILIQVMIPQNVCSHHYSDDPIASQCEDPALDFEGDSGVIGTLKSSESTLQLDVKGQLFQGYILPTSTLMVVDVGPTEVRVEAVINDFVQLERSANPYDDGQDVEVQHPPSHESFAADFTAQLHIQQAEAQVDAGDSDMDEDFDDDAPKSKKRKGGAGGGESGKKGGGGGSARPSKRPAGGGKKSTGGGKKSSGGGGKKSGGKSAPKHKK